MLVQLINKILLLRHTAPLIKTNSGAETHCKDIYVYYATKPLQYINVRNIGISPEHYNILIMASYFSGSEEFFNRISDYDNACWDETILFNTQVDAFAYILSIPKIHCFYTGTDGGIKTNLFLKELFLRHCHLYLYEEGIGNYVSAFDIQHYIQRPWLKKFPKFFLSHVYKPITDFIRNLAGCSDYLGSSRWIRGEYLYFPEFPEIPPRNHNIMPFQCSFLQKISELSNLFPTDQGIKDLLNIQSKKVLIFATNWSGEYSISESDKLKYDVCIVKFHPQIHSPPKISDEKIITVTGSCMTELLVTRLLKNSNTITLRSEFSTSMIYLMSAPIKVEFLNDKVPDFLRALFLYVKRQNKTERDLPFTPELKECSSPLKS